MGITMAVAQATTKPAYKKDGLPSYSEEEIKSIRARMDALKPWYHKIDLGCGLTTPGRDYDKLWQNIRNVTHKLDYKGKSVLDIGSWDGLWAFEAEARGASKVVASDTRVHGVENLLFVKYVRNSKVFPLFNAPVQELQTRLTMVDLDRTFDIVQHFGLLYHLRDPMLSLAQARAVVKEGGYVLIETAGIKDDVKSYMAFNGVAPDFHFYGPSDTWAPTTRCLKEMMVRTALQPVMEEHWSYYEQPKAVKPEQGFDVCRMTIIAKAVSYDTLHRIDRMKLDGSQ